MQHSQFRLPVVAAAVLAASLALGAARAEARQLAKHRKAEAAQSDAQAQGASIPLRALLVIGNDVRDYKPGVFLGHYDFGPRLAKEAERICRETFATLTTTSTVPADPHALDAIDIVILVESPFGQHLGGLFIFTQSLSALFIVRNPMGQEIFRAQQSDTEKGRNLPNVEDRLGEGVSRKFIQDLLASSGLRNLLSPRPATAAEVKPVLADTAVMDSSGLDVPPPPPWNSAAAAPASAPGSGRPELDRGEDGSAGGK